MTRQDSPIPIITSSHSTRVATGTKQRLAIGKSALRAVGTNTFASLIAALVALTSNVLISRQLGPAARGEVAFVLQLGYLVAPFLILGIDRHTLRADSRHEAGRLTRHLVPMTALVTVIFFVAFRDWRTLAPVIALTSSWLSIRRSESLRDHSFARYLSAFIAYQVSVGLCVIVLFLSGNNNWHWWLLPYFLPAFVIFLVEITKNGHTRPQDIFSHVNRHSLQLLPSTIATIVVTRADRLLMPALASASQLGLYAAVATATEPISWIAQALADHRVSRLSSGRKLSAFIRSLAIDCVFFALVSTLAAVLISQILIPLLGTDFASTQLLVLPLSIAAVVLAIYRQLISWHLGGPSPGVVSRIEVATAIFAVPCYSLAIRSEGALGAAWGSLCVYGVGVILALSMAIVQRNRKV